MNLTFFNDLGQIFAWTAAGIFFAYKFYTGWFHPDLSLSLTCDRKPMPGETGLKHRMDFLTVVATVKRGSNMTIRLVDLQALVTFGDESSEKRFAGIERKCVDIPKGNRRFESQKVLWKETPPPSSGPYYLSLAPGDKTQFATHFEVPSDKVCVINVMLFAKLFCPGFARQVHKKSNPRQWRASCVSLPSCDSGHLQSKNERRASSGTD